MNRWLVVIGLWGLLLGDVPVQGQARRAAAAKEASAIGEYNSANFQLRTDLPAEEARELLERLETMLTLVSRYWGKRNPRRIEMNVVRDLSVWPDGLLSADGRRSIEQGGGLTTTQKVVQGANWQAKSVVYAIADRGTPQHEAVHAYCGQAFGGTGPTWYSEGMAEVGQYWRDANDKSVQCHPYVVSYLKSTPAKSLDDLVDMNQVTGDSWQNYAWRWALCHLLGHNSNYSTRFKPLGIALMSEQRGVTFWSVYGTMAPEIEFEYHQFLRHLDVGYRADLCSWDWKTKFTPLKGPRAATTKVQAARGWQATSVQVNPGDRLQYSTEGTWKLSPDGPPLTAAGDDSGRGQLELVLFHNYGLSEPFVWGAAGEWTAEAPGKLYVRCRNDWNCIGDHEGQLTLKIQLAR